MLLRGTYVQVKIGNDHWIRQLVEVFRCCLIVKVSHCRVKFVGVAKVEIILKMMLTCQIIGA